MKAIKREQLREMIDKREDFVLVNVLGSESFGNGHIPGSINVPADENFKDSIQKAVPDKNKKVVVYCASFSCQASPRAAGQMDELGYKNVLDFEGGMEDWKEAGHKVEGSASG